MPETNQPRSTARNTTRFETSPTPGDQGGELERLRAENARLRAELDEARANAKADPNTRPEPTEPSFGMSEGERADLELTGKATSPFTGKPRTAEEEGVERAPTGDTDK
jgi:hypothetical protein